MNSFSGSDTLKSICCLLGFVLPVLAWGNADLITVSKRAEKLFSESLYGDAISLFSQSLAFPADEELKDQLTMRLAACYLKQGTPREALDLLLPLESPFRRNQSLYLMSIAHRQLGNTQSALKLLSSCSFLIPSQDENFIRLEQGYHLFQLGDYSSSQATLSTISWQIGTPLPYFLAQLYLAKIGLKTGDYDKALDTLSHLSQSLPPHHILNSERVYLMGWLYLAKKEDSKAILHFEELLPEALSSREEWPLEVLHGLIISAIRHALTLEPSSDQIPVILSKAETALNQLLIRSPSEANFLLLSEFYFIKAHCLSDPQAYAQAQQLLDRQELFPSQEGLQQALLKKAEAAPSYWERNQFYERLSKDPSQPAAFCSKVLFLKGLNDFKEGFRCQNQQDLQGANRQFNQAALAFARSAELIQESDPQKRAQALKYQALACAHEAGKQKPLEAWHILNELLSNDALLSTFESPQEIHYYSSWIALHLGDSDKLQNARVHLQRAQTEPSAIWSERCLRLEGLISLQLEDWAEAERIFYRLLNEYPDSSFRGEFWFWRAYCADHLQNDTLKKEYLRHAYTDDPQSPYAPNAYFQVYSYRDYMQGQRRAIKHLQAMPLLFPSHPLLIIAHYLIGLHHKKDLVTEDSQVLRRKDWTAAIEAFDLAESTFDALYKKNAIPLADLSYYLQVRCRSQLERGEANFAIAKGSTGGKKQIYLEYAEGVFKDLIQQFNDPHSPAYEKLVSPFSPYPKIWAEAELKLAQVLKDNKCPEEAETILNDSLKHYHDAQTTKAYGLMTVWAEKGKLAQMKNEPEAALQAFINAEMATHEHAELSPDEKLDLWIQQSICHQELNQLDEAMLLLSRVINDDVISPLRVKAMFLRAEIYELQGRPELAIKQLESAARKGGEWAQKSQEKLEKVYGY